MQNRAQQARRGRAAPTAPATRKAPQAIGLRRDQTAALLHAIHAMDRRLHGPDVMRRGAVPATQVDKFITALRTILDT
jgi:hypothetical protein